MLRGGMRLMGSHSQFLGMRCFSTEIFVSKLSFYTTKEELEDIFSPFGTVKEARLMRDRQTGRVKGFGFVKYSSQAEAEKAIKAMDGRVFAPLANYFGFKFYLLDGNGYLSSNRNFRNSIIHKRANSFCAIIT